MPVFAFACILLLMALPAPAPASHVRLEPGMCYMGEMCIRDRHVHSIDRLTRNLRDLLRLLEEMATRGVTVRFHKEKLTFTSDTSPFQKLHLQIIGAVAEFERAFIRERQREGIAIAKRKGKYLSLIHIFWPA